MCLLVASAASAREFDENAATTSASATGGFADQILSLSKTLDEASTAPNTPSSVSYADSSAGAPTAPAAENGAASGASATASPSAAPSAKTGEGFGSLSPARVGEFSGAVEQSAAVGGGIAVPQPESVQDVLGSAGGNLGGLAASLGSLGSEPLSLSGSSNGFQPKLAVAQIAQPKKVDVAKNDAAKKEREERARQEKERQDREPVDSRTKFGNISGDLSLSALANKSKEDKDADKDKDKDEKDKKKDKDKDKDKEKEKKLKEEMEKEIAQIKDPFKPGDYFKLRKRIHDNKNEMDQMTMKDSSLKDKTQKVFDMFNNMDGDSKLRQEYSDFLADKQDENLNATKSILGPSNLERHLVQPSTHLDSPTE